MRWLKILFFVPGRTIHNYLKRITYGLVGAASNDPHAITFKRRLLLNKLIKTIPESNGSKVLKSLNVDIGIICDEFMFECYKSFVNLFYLTPSNYQKLLDETSLDALIIMGTWTGMNNVWKESKKKKHVHTTIEKIISLCKSKNIPVIFQTIEDPVHYQRFLWIAKLADVIFTSAEEVVAKYIMHCNNRNVFVAEFGINPLIHNPMGRNHNNDLKNIVLFSGTWNSTRKDRVDDMSTLFDGVLNSTKELLIVDRNLEKLIPHFNYPDQYRPYLTGSLKYKDLLKSVKLFNWCITMNTVKTSYTMFAMRGYELQACGNLLLSNFSAGIADKFPNIFISTTRKHVSTLFNSLTEIEEQILVNIGIRNVMSEHTYAHRLADILTKAGVDINSSTLPKVAVILEEDSETLRTMFHKQSYKDKELFITDLSNEQFNHYDVICYFGADHHYGTFYLEDMVNAFIYTNCDFVTKCVYRLGGLFSQQIKRNGPEHNYVEDIQPLKWRTIYWRESYHYDDLFSKNRSNQIVKKLGYSSDSLNYYYGDALEEKLPSSNYKFTVIISTFNSYKTLERTLFSLKLEAYFSDIEILIIDNGSTDGITPGVIREYSDLYSNISSHFYNEVGNFDFSRSRNYGLALTQTDYLVFLNPTDAGKGSYSRLYDELLKRTDCDFVYGYSHDITTDIHPINQHCRNDTLIEAPLLFFITNQFKPYKVASAMYRKDFLVKQNLKLSIDWTNDDILFISQTYFKANKIFYLNEAIVDQYRCDQDYSHTHFFEHSIELEHCIKDLFSKAHVYDLFLKERHAWFIEMTYLKHYIELKNKSDSKTNHHLKQIFEIHHGIYDYLSHTGKFLHDKIVSQT